MTSTVRKLDLSSVEVTVELSKDDLCVYVEEAERELAASLNLDGFRPGKVPREEVRKHVSEQQIRAEALEIAVHRSLTDVVRQQQIDVLDQEKFKIQENTPQKLRYQVNLILYPTVSLGQYKKVTVKKNEISVKDQEIEQVLHDIANSRKKDDDAAPELTDDFAKQLGNFASLSDLKEQVRVGLLQEKEMKENERIRIELLKAIIATSTISVPSRMIETQLDAMISNLDSQLHAQGMELGPYLAHMKKTQEDLRKDWRDQSETQVKMLLVLHEVAKVEHLGVDDNEIKEVFERELRPEDLKDIDIERLKQRAYTELLNKKVFEFLVTHAIITS